MASNYQITVTIDGRDNLSDELRQINTQLGQIQQNTTNANNSMQRMENQISGLRNGFSNVNGLLQQFGLGISAMGIAGAVTELGELGREVTAVETTFEQLAGGPDAAARSLENLRDITGGVVDDMTLMRGANSLLLTGLASTNDQAAELVNLGYRLSAAMGVDAKEGIENLNAALLNNSYARLDTLGISAAQVRARVEELKESGMDMSEAFSTAVLEQGREKLERLGEAANTGETSFNRMRTSFNNAKQGLAEFTAQGFEAGAQLLEIIGLMGEVGVGNVLTAAGGETVDLGQQERTQVIQNRANEITLGRLGFEGVEDANLEPAMVSQMIQTSSAGQGIGGVDLQVMQMQAWHEATMEYTMSQYVLNSAIETVTESQGLFAAVSDSASLAVGRLNRANSVEQSMLEGLGVAFDTMTQRAEEFQSVGGIEIMSQEDADAMMSNAAMMEDWFADLQQMAEDTNFQYISEEELANAEAMVDEAGALADQAERAADNFERMKLAQMMGTTGGGRLGELTDMVTGAIGDEGLAATVQLELDMRSGRTSDIEQAFEDEFTNTIAQIAEQVGPEAAADAAQRALAALEDGQLLGLTDEQIVESVRGAIGAVDFSQSEDAGLRNMGNPMATGTSISPESATQEGKGITDDAMAAWAMGGSPMGFAGEGEGMAGAGLGGMVENLEMVDELSLNVSQTFTDISAIDMSGVMDPFVHSVEIADEAAVGIRTKLDAIASTTFRTSVVLDVMVNDPTGLALGMNPSFSAAVGVSNANQGVGAGGGTGNQ